MLTGIKNRFVSAFAPDLPSLPSNNGDNQHGGQRQGSGRQSNKLVYARPTFLQLLTADELRASADRRVRPIIVPRDINLLPWTTGYAECINSGKSSLNEDQAAFYRQVLSDPNSNHPDLPYIYFGIFDGHAGAGTSLAASLHFHHILHQKLVDCIDMLLPRDADENSKLQMNSSVPHPIHFQRYVSRDDLIIGALESAFYHMDNLIDQDYSGTGGCTACVALFIDGKVFVANAGDSRAVLCQRRSRPAPRPGADAGAAAAKGAADSGAGATASSKSAVATPEADHIEQEPEDELLSYSTAFSFDHTPETERERLINVALMKPLYLKDYFMIMEYVKRPHVSDLGQRILCRHGTMKGWTYKTLTKDDLRFPVVNGEGKRSRLLGTLGVTRGFGDHFLTAMNTDLPIKPFLTPQPDVRQRDLSQVVSIPDEHNEDGDYGVLVMATDGLWDVSENDAVSRTVFQTLSEYPEEKHRYTMAAQELVARARGKVNVSGHWRLSASKAATGDDISVFVIPLHEYYKEHIEWTHNYKSQQSQRMSEKAEEAAHELGDIMAEEAHVVEEHPQQTQVVVQVEKLPTELQKEQQQQQKSAELEPEDTLVVELTEDTPLQARLETVSDALQQVQLDASAHPEAAT